MHMFIMRIMGIIIALLFSFIVLLPFFFTALKYNILLLECQAVNMHKNNPLSALLFCYFSGLSAILLLTEFSDLPVRYSAERNRQHYENIN